MAEVVDKVTKRYGWTEEYLLSSIPYARFRDIVETIYTQEAKEMEQKYKDLCFLGWQVLIPFAGESLPPFDEYYKSMTSPAEEQEVIKGTPQERKDNSLNKANDILSKFQVKGGEKNNGLIQFKGNN